MMTSLSLRVRRLIAVGLLLAVPFTLWMLLIGPIWAAASQTSTAIAEARHIIGHQEAVTRTLSAALAAPAPEQLTQASALFLASATEEGASAELQSIVKELAARHATPIHTAAALPTAVVDGNRMTGVRLSVTGAFSSVQTLIVALERSSPPLFISLGRLARLESGQRSPAEEQIIEATLEILAAVRPETKP